jgi:hypothetical protein
MSRNQALSAFSLTLVAATLVLTGTVAAHAQTTVALPDTSQATTFDAEVSEQAHVTVPSTVTFNVNDVSAITTASAASVSATNIVLADATKQLKISLQAAAAGFTPPVTGATTWAASDISWAAATWTGSTSTGPVGGTLSNTAYNPVAFCDPDVAVCSTTALVFKLAPNTSVTRAGSHTIVVNWKFESIGT